MKFIYALLISCCASFAGRATIVALSPTGAGGFESGATFPANGWTVVNPASAANEWYLGSAAGTYAGSNCAYVTNTAGGAYAYTTTVAKTCHFYRDIAIPASSVSITLSFYWKGFGEVGADQMLVYTAPPTVTPVANNPASPSTSMAGAALVWTQPDASTAGFTLATISLPSTLAGTTVRLIFTWQNNASGGTSPGAAIDNISLTYDCTAPAPITGTPSVCTGSATSLADATTFGAWSSSTPTVGSVSSSGVVTGIAAGTTTISYSAGCLAPATAVVSVSAAPAAFTGPTTVCLGSTATIGESSGPGTWTSTSTPAGIAPVSSSGDITGAALGTANITYSNMCGSPVSETVTVTPLPAAITATITHVCAGGGTITLTDPTTGGTWSASPVANGTIATGTGVVTGISGGTITVTYTSSAGCEVTTPITIDPTPPAITGVVPICTGSFTTVSDALPGGTWSSSVPGIALIGSSSGIVSGVAGGTTVLSYTNACGSATTVFTVNPYPGAIVGDLTICLGGNTTLADPLVGGTWSSSNPAVATVVSPPSGYITSLAVGTTFVTYTMPGGCNTTTLLTVLDVPPAITGIMHLCPSFNVTLSESIAGGTWSSANPAVATVDAVTGKVTGITSDTADIIYTTPAPAGCTVQATVTVNPVPGAIIGKAYLCMGGADTVFDPAPGGAWSSLSTSVATINSGTGIITPMAPGTVTFVYTLPTSCSISGIFTTKPAPVPVILFDNITNTLYTDSTYATYQWYHSILGLDTGATTYKIKGKHNGNYYVVVVDGYGCTGISADFYYTVAMGAAAVTSYSDISIYPDPATDVVYISSAQKVRAEIYSIEGKEEMTQDDARQMNISRLPRGMYIVTLYNDEGMKVAEKKLLKE